jgi:hypothetical protein
VSIQEEVFRNGEVSTGYANNEPEIQRRGQRSEPKEPRQSAPEQEKRAGVDPGSGVPRQCCMGHGTFYISLATGRACSLACGGGGCR